MPNRLAVSTSPYLRQHAGNPVDWREWGEEAFAEARERDVPIFLSVGYSASIRVTGWMSSESMTGRDRVGGGEPEQVDHRDAALDSLPGGAHGTP
jgi:hypothetical protein